MLILLTGATGLIGKTLSAALLDEGHSLIVTSSNQEKLDQLRNELAEQFPLQKTTGIAQDLLAPNGPKRLVEAIVRKRLQPEGFVHCARALQFLSNERSDMRENWLGQFFLDTVAPTETLLNLNEHTDTLRSVILLSSIYGITPPRENLYPTPTHMPPIHYGVCKAAQLHLCKELAIRYAKHKIRVNAVIYGGVKGRASREFEETYGRNCPTGKMLDLDELAGPVAFLLSNASSATTGQSLYAEGGWTI